MGKEIDEIKEKMADRLCPIVECQHNHKCLTCPRMTAMEELVNEILVVETSTLRLAIVKKKAELPNRYLTAWEGTGTQCYKLAQQDMLNAGFVQEVKETASLLADGLDKACDERG